MPRGSHFQPYIEGNNLDPDEGNRTLCKACTFPIFSTPLYNENINFPLHKDCANLPMLLNGHVIHPNKPLVLLKETLPRGHENECWVCKEKCEGGFIYYCPDTECQAVLHLLCALPIGTIKVLHGSHMHELVPINKKLGKFFCNACARVHYGPSYLCNVCGFQIHRDCALLPNRIRLKEHHGDQHVLVLTYSFVLSVSGKCEICLELLGGNGGYFCTRCKYTAHIGCATFDPKSFSPALLEDMSGLLHLPMKDEQTNLMPYLLENAMSSKSTEKEEEVSIHAKKLFKETHLHPLIHHGHTSLYIKDDDDQKYRLCNGCVSPISLPFYSCPECSDFFLHSCCANLPLEFRPQRFEDEETHILHPKKHDDEFPSPFRCYLCNFFCNGFIYTFTPDHRLSNVRVAKLHVECPFLPKYVTHEAHPKSHILFLTTTPATFLNGECRCCGFHLSGAWYSCSVCQNFKIDVGCAKLPETVTHKFDKHPLKLTFTRSSSKFFPTTELDDEPFCEICEHDINTKLWYYGCDRCDNWFHINCIPSVGALSKIKFGDTIRVSGHDCPLTSIRLITEYSHRCGICKDTIEGFEDEIAFECSKCDFRVHFSCAKDNRSFGFFNL